MAKLREGERRVQLCFIRPEDRRLYEFMEKEAYRCRWELPTFILASLTEAFKDKMEEYEVNRLAEEAAQKVRERNVTPEPPPLPETPIMAAPKPSPVSMEQAARDAEAEIAKLDALAAKTMGKSFSRKRGSSPPVPPLPK